MFSYDYRLFIFYTVTQPLLVLLGVAITLAGIPIYIFKMKHIKY